MKLNFIENIMFSVPNIVMMVMITQKDKHQILIRVKPVCSLIEVLFDWMSHIMYIQLSTVPRTLSLEETGGHTFQENISPDLLHIS